MPAFTPIPGFDAAQNAAIKALMEASYRAGHTDAATPTPSPAPTTQGIPRIKRERLASSLAASRAKRVKTTEEWITGLDSSDEDDMPLAARRARREQGHGQVQNNASGSERRYIVEERPKACSTAPKETVDLTVSGDEAEEKEAEAEPTPIEDLEAEANERRRILALLD